MKIEVIEIKNYNKYNWVRYFIRRTTHGLINKKPKFKYLNIDSFSHCIEWNTVFKALHLEYLHSTTNIKEATLICDALNGLSSIDTQKVVYTSKGGKQND